MKCDQAQQVNSLLFDIIIRNPDIRYLLASHTIFNDRGALERDGD